MAVRNHRWVQLSLSDVLNAALAGELRRAVLTAPEASVSVKARLFTGAVRDLVNVRESFCTWPGCDIPLRFCQADHTVPFGLVARPLRRTAPRNAVGITGSKNTGTERGDVDGRWFVQRPDGTLIEPAA